MTTSKSPRRVLGVAYEAACRALPAHRHKFSPKKFTQPQPQLLACLVLKEFARLDYRGLAEHLDDHPDLARLIDLKAVAHYTTFQKAAARLLKAAPARAMFDAVLDRALNDKVRNRRVPLAAVDGTGMESRHVSRHYVKRRSATGSGTQETTYSRYPKVVLVTDCRTHLVLSAVPGRGPASDLVLFRAALKQAAGRARIGTVWRQLDFPVDDHYFSRTHQPVVIRSRLERDGPSWPAPRGSSERSAPRSRSDEPAGRWPPPSSSRP